LINANTQDSSANLDWLLSDSNSGIVTELSVSDIAASKEKEAAAFSDKIEAPGVAFITSADTELVMEFHV
jgi:hypothetical protein